tara:strand:- start:1472 stop:2374 length:903 start_codon:yes stop_codon:yes gene_type:complete
MRQQYTQRGGSLEGTKEFLNSNSIVAKAAFILLVLIVFVVLIRIGINILYYIFTPSTNPFLFNGMIDAKQSMVIPQNPSNSNAIPIMRSVDKTEGIEFTWSVWIYIDDFNYKRDEYKHIFHKGNNNINLNEDSGPIGLNFPNNAPGLYITPDINNLLVVMNTFDIINEEVLVKDIPINKWVNVIIRVDKNNQLDVYINGVLTKRHILRGVPKQNYGDVYVSQNGGFSGYSSCLRYFDSAIGTNKIQSIIDSGACLNMLNGTDTTQQPRYLSTRWYFAGANDMYNPRQQPTYDPATNTNKA